MCLFLRAFSISYAMIAALVCEYAVFTYVCLFELVIDMF